MLGRPHKIPSEVLAQCQDFQRLIKACSPDDRSWWVIHGTADPRTPRRSVGVRRVGRRWRKNIDSNRVENYCE